MCVYFVYVGTIRLVVLWLQEGLIYFYIYVTNVKFLNLQVLLYQVAALHLYSFSLMFLYICIPFACWAPHNSQTYRHIPAYIKCDVQLIKVAPDDGLI